MRSRKGGRITEYFYDSWAILEHLANPKLKPYFRAGMGRTTWLNLMEVYWALLRDGKPEKVAQSVVSSFEPCLLEFTFEDVMDAMALKLSWHRKRRPISYVDAIGYHIALERRSRFLTGDPVFRGMPMVTFVGLPSR